VAEDAVMVGWSLLVAEVIACSALPKIRVLGTGTDDALLTGDGAAAVTLPPIAKGIVFLSQYNSSVPIKDEDGIEADFELSC